MDASPNDTLRPAEVMDILSDQETRMIRLRPEMEENKATYLTRYASYQSRPMGAGSGQQGNIDARTNALIEVNRVWGGVESQASQLYPHARRTVLSPDESGRGEVTTAQAALNAWWRKEGTQHRMLAHLRQALLYPGSGLTMEVRPGRGSPIQRTEFTVTPYWEMILDCDVFDSGHQRFRGRRYWLPLRQAIAAWPQLAAMGVKGSQRDEFLRPFLSGSVEGQVGASTGTHENGSNVIMSQYAKNPKGEGGRSADWVEIVEFVNLVDGFSDETGDYQGRFEVYVRGQSGFLASEPLVRSRVPFTDADGVPLPHMVPTLFAFEPEYPLRGIPPIRRIMPQQRELNTLRSEVLRRVRQNVTKIVVRGDVWGSDEKAQLASSTNLEVIKLETDEDLRATVMQLDTLPIGQDLKTYADVVERDLNIVLALSANRSGQANKSGTTAYEVQSINLFDDVESKKQATTFDTSCIELSRLALAGFMLAAQTPADHRGGYTTMRADQKVTATAVVDSGVVEPPIAEVAAAATSDAKSEASAGVSPAALALVRGPPTDAPDVAAVHVEGDAVETKVAVPQQAWRILDPETNRTIEVTVDALDGNFGVTFVDGADTPQTAAARQQNLVAIQDKYMALWDVVQKGGPMAIVARRMMVALHDSLKLPKDLHPDRMQEALDAEAKKAPGEPPPVAAQHMTGAAPAQGGDPLQRLLAALGALAQDAEKSGAQDVAASLAKVAEALQGGDIPGAILEMDNAYTLASMGGHVELEGQLGAIRDMMEKAAGAPQPQGEPAETTPPEVPDAPV